MVRIYPDHQQNVNKISILISLMLEKYFFSKSSFLNFKTIIVIKRFLLYSFSIFHKYSYNKIIIISVFSSKIMSGNPTNRPSIFYTKKNKIKGSAFFL